MKRLLIAFGLGLIATHAGGEPERYIVAPVKRDIGFDSDRPNPTTVVAEGVDAALTQASEDGVRFVVFEIDGGQGSAAEAALVADAILRHNDSLETIAVIRECRGPSLFIAMACEHWFVVSKGRRPALSIELDEGEERFAEDLARIAKTGGRSDALARALAEPEGVLYATTEQDGPAEFNSDGQGEPLDESTTERLELTAEQLVGLGMARDGARTRELWELLGLEEEWERHGKPNEAIGPDMVREMIASERERQKELEEIHDGLAEIDRRAKDAQWRHGAMKRDGTIVRIDDDPKYDRFGREIPRSKRIKALSNQIGSAFSGWSRVVEAMDLAFSSIDEGKNAIDMVKGLERARPFASLEEAEVAAISDAVGTLEKWREILQPLRQEADAEKSYYGDLLSEIRGGQP